jgi:carbonic anhydrase
MLTTTQKDDIAASIVVFLVATPLCLGIALASGAPLFSGVIAGVLGGMVVGCLSGSPLGVSGPAAGLAVIVYAGIKKFGFEGFLTASLLAGIGQTILGLLRAGRIAYYVPSSVIKGMLSAIGITIILKQIPHAVGYDHETAGDLAFFQPDGSNTLSELVAMLSALSTTPLLISLLSLSILLLWDTAALKKIFLARIIPAPLVVVLLGLSAKLLTDHVVGFSIDPDHLVRLPIITPEMPFSSLFSSPDYSFLGRTEIWGTAFVLCLVGSIETLLCVEATDKMDPLKRVTPTNRELIAQGVGNIFSSLIGGLPITQVIVRSSANVQAGGKTKLSAILHGVLILVCVLTIPKIMNQIPLASLAAILLVVGYKLASPKIVKGVYKQGKEQLIPYLVTVFGVIFTDLLIGVCAGLCFAIVNILRNSMKESYRLISLGTDQGGVHIIELSEELVFLNKAATLEALNHIPANSRAVIDATRTQTIDIDVLEVIEDFIEAAPARNIDAVFQRPHSLSIQRSKSEESLVTTQKLQDTLSPEEVIERLKLGNVRFRTGATLRRNHRFQVTETADGQHPLAVVLSCIDSRAPVELIFDQGVGDLFIARIAGNILNEDILASLEFACGYAGSKLIIVMGHTRCGAVTAACNHIRKGHLDVLFSKLESIVHEGEKRFGSDQQQFDKLVGWVTEQNVSRVAEAITERSVVLNRLIEGGNLKVAKALYHVETGEVQFLD